MSFVVWRHRPSVTDITLATPPRYPYKVMTCLPQGEQMARKGGLTVITIQNLAPKDSRYEVGDPACPGLYLQVHPSGAKSWAFRFRFAGRSRKLTIGSAYTDNGVEVL